ncbi:MAG: LPS assembly lipoprotein LptE [Pseudomonadota bacterium]
MRLAALSLLLIALAGCQLSPVYGGGARSAAARTLGSIAVPAIPERKGYLVRQALLDRVDVGEEGARYRLDVALDDAITGFGIRGDDSITRERRTLRARWQLIDTQTGNTLIDETVRADAGIDVVSSDFAVVASETDALERLAEELATDITARIATYAKARAR